MPACVAEAAKRQTAEGRHKKEDKYYIHVGFTAPLDSDVLSKADELKALII